MKKGFDYPSDKEIRYTPCIKLNLSTAFLKLLFPHVRTPADFSEKNFVRLGFRPAMKMHYTIRYQLGLMNEQFQGKYLPALRIRQEA